MSKKMQFSRSVIAIVIAFIVVLTGSILAVSGYQKSKEHSTVAELNAGETNVTTGYEIDGLTALESFLGQTTEKVGYLSQSFSLNSSQIANVTRILPTGYTIYGNDNTIYLYANENQTSRTQGTYTNVGKLPYNTADNQYVTGLLFSAIEFGARLEDINVTMYDYYAITADETSDVASSLGGICGYNAGTMKDVTFTMKDSALLYLHDPSKWKEVNIGGLAGINNGTIANSTIVIEGSPRPNINGQFTGSMYAYSTRRWATVGGMVGCNAPDGKIYGSTVDIRNNTILFCQGDGYKGITSSDDCWVGCGGMVGRNAGGSIAGVYIKTMNFGACYIKQGTETWGAANALVGVHNDTSKRIKGNIFVNPVGASDIATGRVMIEYETNPYMYGINADSYDVSFIDSDLGYEGMTVAIATKSPAGNNQIYWGMNSEKADSTLGLLNEKLYESKIYTNAPFTFDLTRFGDTKTAKPTSETLSFVYGEHVLAPVVSSDLTLDKGSSLYQKTYDGQEHYVTVRYDVKTYTSEELNGVFQTLYDVRGTDAATYTMPADAIKPSGTVIDVNDVRLYISYTALLKVANLSITKAPIEFGVERNTIGLLEEVTPSVKGNLVAGHKVKVQAKDNMIIGNTIKFNTAGTFELVPEVWNASTNVTRNYEFINNSSRINVKVDPIGIILDKGISPRFGFEKNQDGEYIVEDGKYKINSRYIEVNVKCFTANSSVESVFAGDYELTANDPNIKDTWYKGTIEKKTDKITAKYVNDKYNVSIIGGTALPNDDAVTEGVTNIDCAYGDRLVLRADSVENFSYWKVNGVMMSTSAEYEIVVRQGMEIEAVNEGAIQDEIIIRYENLNGDVLEMHRLPSNADILAYVNGEILSGIGLVNYTNYELYREWAGTWTVYSTNDDGVYVARPDMQASDDEGAVQKVNVTYNGKTVAYDFNSVVTLDAGKAVSWYVDGQMVRYGVSEYTFTALADCEITTDYSEDYATGVTLTAYTEGLGESGKSAKVYFASTFGTDMFYDQNGGDYTDVNIRVLVYRKGESVEVAYSAVVTSYNVNTYQFIRGMSFDEAGEFEAVVEFEYYGETITSAKVEFTLA